MKRLIALYLLLTATIATAIPLDYFNTYVTNYPNESKKGSWVQLLARGSGTNQMYVLEVDPTTGALPVSGSFSFSVDKNYGAVGANTLRTASQIGNATGAADFDAGNYSAQTLRVVVASDQPAIPVTSAPNVTDYGATTNAQRVASQIGNSTGAAAFGTGTRSAQTLRVTVATDDVVPASQSGTWNINDVTGTISLPTGASTAAKQDTGNTSLASIDGKIPALGQTTMSGSLPVAIASDQTAVPASQSGTWTVQPGNTANTTPWLATINQGGNSATVTASNALKVDGSAVTQPVSAASLPLPTGAATEATLSTLSGKIANDYGVSSGAVRTASQLGNATGSVDYGSGAAGAQTLRTVLSTRQESVTTPLAAQLSNGSSAVDYDSGAAGSATLRTVLSTRQESVATPLAAQLSNGTTAIDYGSGSAGAATIRVVPSTRSESAATPLSVRISDGTNFSTPAQAGRSYADSARLDYSSTSVTTGAWVQLIASTAAVINQIYLFDSSGQTLELGTGAAASETRKAIIPPGGIDGPLNLAIPAGTRVSIRAVSATADVGEIDFTGLQ